MKLSRLIFVLILLHSLSFGVAMAQHVPANNNHDEEIACAHQWLLEHGLNTKSLSLSLTYEDIGFLVFEDSRNHCFCVVANKEMWPLLYGPVLAYSTEVALYMNSKPGQQYNGVMKPFRDQLAALKMSAAGPDTATAIYTPKNKEVLPMLGSTKWNQYRPYNMFAPTKNGNRVLIGCVPTAVAMTMRYHQWPERGEDCCYYMMDSKTMATMDFSKCTPLWKSYKDIYFPEDTLDEGAQNLSKLMVSIGLSVDASFSDTGTSASMKNVKPTLCNHFGYSGHIAFHDMRRHNLTEEQMEAILYKELDEGRPCIVSNAGHAFVCDGYSDGFLHYNFGWSGHYNGYYRLMTGRYNKLISGEPPILVKYFISGIEPQQPDGGVSREITLKKAGTLQDMLTDTEKETITKLTLKGPLNGSDIKLLRKMAGANDGFSLDGWRGGALTELNLREAKIKDDKTAYYSKPAKGVWTSYENNKPRKYDFSKSLTKSDWISFKNGPGSRMQGMQIVRTDDDKYFEHYFCQRDMIGKFMFANCSSLKNLVLPITTEKVDDHAFQDCTSLTSIVLPPSTESIGRDPFRGCFSLEEVLLPRNLNVKDGTICEGCSPILRSAKRY